MIKSECSGDYKRLAIAWVTVPDELEVTLRNPNPNHNPNPNQERSSSAASPTLTRTHGSTRDGCPRRSCAPC